MCIYMFRAKSKYINTKSGKILHYPVKKNLPNSAPINFGTVHTLLHCNGKFTVGILYFSQLCMHILSVFQPFLHLFRRILENS